MSTTSAPLAMPVASAIQPTSRPITSSTIVRRWLAARRLQAVGHVHADLDRAHVADGEIGLGEIVVDRLRHADERNLPLLGEAGEDARAAVTADADQGVEIERAKALDRLRRPVLDAAVRHRVLERIALVDGFQHRAALAQELAVDVVHRQVAIAHRPFQHTGSAGEDADDGQSVFLNGAVGDRAYGGVQSGAVAAGGQHAPMRLCFSLNSLMPACLPFACARPRRIARRADAPKGGSKRVCP